MEEVAMAPGQVLVKDAPREEVIALLCYVFLCYAMPCIACHFSFPSLLTIYNTELDALTSFFPFPYPYLFLSF